MHAILLPRIKPRTTQEAQEAELGWRDAADAVFLIAGPEVTTTAAEEHVRSTDARIKAVHQGTWESGQGTYLRLNEAMKKDIIVLQPR